MILSPMSPETVADAMMDPEAIGRPSATRFRPTDRAASVSPLRASIGRMVEITAEAALIFTLCFALPAIFGGS